MSDDARKVTTWEESWQQLWDEAQERHGGKLSIRTKYSCKWGWTILKWLHKLVTFGKGPDMLEEYFATAFGIIWTPGDGSRWEKMGHYSRRSLLSHEIDHIDLHIFGDHDARSKDPSTLKRKSRFFQIWHGIKYLLGWPLPFKYARYRAQVEMWGYQRNIDQYVASHGGDFSDHYREHIYKQFTSASYGWMATHERGAEILNEMISSAKERYRNGELDHLKDLR